MMIQDINNDIYQVGLRLHYEPKKLMFDPAVLDTNAVKMLACGRKHYIIVTNSNDLLIWGSVISGDSKATASSEGYSLHSGEELGELQRGRAFLRVRQRRWQRRWRGSRGPGWGR